MYAYTHMYIRMYIMYERMQHIYVCTKGIHVCMYEYMYGYALHVHTCIHNLGELSYDNYN